MESTKSTPTLDLIGMSEELSKIKQEVRELWKSQAIMIRDYKEIKHDLNFEKKFSSKLADKNNDLKKELGDLQLSLSLFKESVAKKFTTVKCEE